MSRLFKGKVIFFLFVLLIVDLCFAPILGRFRPGFLYLWVLYVALYEPAADLIPAAIAVGVLRDLTGTQPFGVETISLSAMAGFVVFFLQKLDRDFFLMRGVMAAAFIFGVSTLNLILSSFVSSKAQVTWQALAASFSTAIASAVVMPVFFYGLKKIFPQGSQSLKQYELFG